MLALIAAGASAPTLMDQFLTEKEGNSPPPIKTASASGPFAAGATRVDGKPCDSGHEINQAKCGVLTP